MIVEIDKIPDDLFKKLKKIIKDKSIEANQELIGNIEEEYNLDKYISLIEPYLLKTIMMEPKLIKIVNERYDCNSVNKSFKLKNLWVNFQKKNEFNPIHNHSGIFSFIIFIKIPFLIEDQLKISPGKKASSNLPGVLQFLGFDQFRPLVFHNFFVDKKWEQSMLIFPASYAHCVYPFYKVNDYRITVSGNIKIDVQ
mgnify:CR=1 FL=1